MLLRHHRGGPGRARCAVRRRGPKGVGSTVRTTRWSPRGRTRGSVRLSTSLHRSGRTGLGSSRPGPPDPLYMIEGGFEEGRDLVVAQGVHPAPAGSLDPDQIVLAQHSELVGDRGLLHAEQLSELANRSRPADEDVQDLDPARSGQPRTWRRQPGWPVHRAGGDPRSSCRCRSVHLSEITASPPGADSQMPGTSHGTRVEPTSSRSSAEGAS